VYDFGALGNENTVGGIQPIAQLRFGKGGVYLNTWDSKIVNFDYHRANLQIIAKCILKLKMIIYVMFPYVFGLLKKDCIENDSLFLTQ